MHSSESTYSADATPAEVQSIVDTARSEARPADWFVWTLRRDRVQRAALGWAGTALFGLILLVPLFRATVPANFSTRAGAGLVVFTILMLLVVGAVAFGGLWLLAGDLFRLAHADQYLLIVTPGDYVKLEPRRVTHVPMANVAYVTVKGVKAPPAAAAGRTGAVERPAADPVLSVGRLGGLFGTPTRSREAPHAPSLAFIDTRTDREVVVATDNAFDELLVLEDVLNLYAHGFEMGSRRRS